MGLFTAVLPGLLVLGQAIAISADRFPDCVNGPLRNNTVCNVNATPSQRAAALVAAMTIEEKLVNFVDHSLGAERLGLPKYDWWSEALHGVAYSPGVHFNNTNASFWAATSFASPIIVAAAFDDALVQAVAAVIGKEARAFANAGGAGLDFWTPNINPFKDPRWGRGQETPGEDPRRVSNYVKHLIAGLEGANPDRRQVIATCKHYAAYDLERWNGVVRYAFDAIVSMRDLVEYYLPPFRQCARDSNVGSIMCSYNSVNGTPACANEYLMKDVLREHWGWTKHDNYIVSDCNAVHNIYADHKWLKNAAQAAGAALTAGTDNVCEAGGWSTDVVGAFNQSLVTEAVLDTSLRRQYEGLVRVGYFDGEKDPYRGLGWKDVITEESVNLARTSAADGMVLLKNDGTLPVKLGKNKTIAIIGFWANSGMSMLGNYNGRPPILRTPLNAANDLGVKTIWANGPLNVTSTNMTEQAIKAAQSSDLVFYFGGIDGRIENEDRDRTNITWPDAQLSFLSAISSLGKPVVVVQMGTQIDDTPLLSNKNISAILWAGYPGMHGGTAVFDILTGAKAPAGRLPVTQYPGNYVSTIPMTDMSLAPSNSSPGRTYKWYDNAVLPFGYGLHYTTFTAAMNPYGSPPAKQAATPAKKAPTVVHTKNLLDNCTATYKDLCPFPRVPLTVTNTGSIPSDFVALFFVNSAEGPAPHPLKELIAYRRLRDIKAGETRVVWVDDLTLGHFARVDDSGNTVLYAGQYCVSVDEPKQDEICYVLEGGDQVLDVWPQPKGNGTVVGRDFKGGKRWRPRG